MNRDVASARGLPNEAGLEDRTPKTASITLPAEAISPRSARELLRLLARSWHIPDPDDADLLLTEVVTNVVVHAHTTMSLRMSWRGERLRVEVSDFSPVMPHARRATRRSENGRGLLLLDRLADAWGVTEHPHTETIDTGAGDTGTAGDERADTGTFKTVWFELVPRDAGEDHEVDLDLHAAFAIDMDLADVPLSGDSDEPSEA